MPFSKKQWSRCIPTRTDLDTSNKSTYPSGSSSCWTNPENRYDTKILSIEGIYTCQPASSSGISHSQKILPRSHWCSSDSTYNSGTRVSEWASSEGSSSINNSCRSISGRSTGTSSSRKSSQEATLIWEAEYTQKNYHTRKQCPMQRLVQVQRGPKDPSQLHWKY